MDKMKAVRTDEDEYREYLLSRIRPLCLEAIASMQYALDEAQRRVCDVNTAPEVMIQRVNHCVVWAWANASGNLETAISHLYDVRRTSEIERNVK